MPTLLPVPAGVSRCPGHLGRGGKRRLQFLGFGQGPDKVVKALKSHIYLPIQEDSSILAADETGNSQAEALAQSHTAGPQNGSPRPHTLLAQVSGDTHFLLRPKARAEHPS